MTTYTVVTSCSDEQLADYGQRMIDTYQKFWPAEIQLRFVPDDGMPDWQKEFVQRHKHILAHCGQVEGSEPGTTKYSFRHDAVRFSYKVGAITSEAEIADTDILIWLDADTLTHSPVDTKWLGKLLPKPADLAWLERPHYPEVGFLAFRLSACRSMLAWMASAYQTDAIFHMAEQHDGFVWKVVVEALPGLRVRSLSPDFATPHPFVNSSLGERLDHMKGKRKKLGRTPVAQRKIKDGVAYWKG